jgi:signal transduction histidine kinase
LIDPEANRPPVVPLYPPNRVYSREQLDVLNILVHPVWVFDVDHRKMSWANEAAVAMWNASSLLDLVARNFDDMSEATVTRLKTYQHQFRLGLNIVDQWTVYPKGEPKTVQVTCSGIRLCATVRNPSMLVEAIPINNVDPQMLRGVEMLRHLPVPIGQFDLATGQCMYENPEATLQKLNHNNATDTNNTTMEQAAEDGPEGPTTTTTIPDDDSTDDGDTVEAGFVERFVDPTVGQDVLKQLQTSTDHNFTIHLEAEIKTKHGHRWSAIQLRKSSDPVTAKPVLLYSSKDMSDAIRARQEKEARLKKSEFLAIMAHEIRTPLHQVTGFIDLLAITQLDSEQRSFVKLLMSSAQGLMTVINDVLDYSKLEAGKMKLESIPYEPLNVVEGSLAAVRASCEERGLYLNMDWDCKIPFRVMGDPNRLRQILLNLLSNAVKFTKQGGISVYILDYQPHESGGSTPMIKFVVKDTGIGISEEHIDLIFNQYQQGSASVARNFGGTGLGLSICKLLVQNMGGTIGLHSEYEKGSSFWFTLPAEVPQDNVDGGPGSLDNSFRTEGVMHILVVEDNKVNQKLLTKMLGRMGHTFDVAGNGMIAVEMTQQKSYDAVLME